MSSNHIIAESWQVQAIKELFNVPNYLVRFSIHVDYEDLGPVEVRCEYLPQAEIGKRDNK